jgi:carboxymethylenebutenolidase
MQEQHIDIQTADGSMNTFITCPDGDGPFPVVIFYMDAPGKREELHDMARRIATVGYYVVLPNLYYRDEREFHLGMPGATRERMFEMMNNISNQMVCDDTQSMFDFLANQSEASAGPIGVVGYCMSGPFVFAAAAAFPDRIKASASFHGVRLCIDAPTSPHLTAAQITGEMYFGCAQTDEWAPPEMVDQLDVHLKSTGINYTIEWYPDTEHGFVFPQRGEKYHKEAAERHWERVFGLLKRNVG